MYATFDHGASLPHQTWCGKAVKKEVLLLAIKARDRGGDSSSSSWAIVSAKERASREATRKERHNMVCRVRSPSPIRSSPWSSQTRTLRRLAPTIGW